MTTAKRAAGATQRAWSPDPLVLDTSLSPPRIRREHIERPRLLERLDDPSVRLVLVAAPPGFGKSTFLAEWHGAGNRRAAWLSLDEADNDPARFTAALIAALRRVEPMVGASAIATLRGPAADLVGSVLPMLLNDLARLESGLTLVLEDYHLVTSGDVHRALAYLVERAPSTFRIIVSSRQDPALPLARLRARGELIEVRADDLRFTETETSDFLRRALGLDLSDDDVARLHARTEGWPAAVYLAALVLRGRRDPGSVIEQFAGDDRYVVDYLTTEVLARQPPDLRTFLLQTSILGRFCGPLADATTGRVDSTDRLSELERSNLLLVALDTRREWYRYHHLFGDLLRHELEASDPSIIPELHRRASAWYRANGYVVDAATHAIAAGDVPTVAELVARSYSQFLGEGQLATVIGWLEAIPESAAAADWLLAFGGAVVLANGGRIDDAERWLGLAESAPQVARDGQEPGVLLPALAGTLRLLRGDIAGTVANERRALDGIPEDAPWAFGPRMVLASGLWWSGAAREAESVLEAATRVAERSEVAVDAVYALGVRAAIALELDDEARAFALSHEAMDRLHRAALEEHAWTAMAQITYGTLLARRAEPAAGVELVERGLRLGERLRAWQVTVAANLALAEIGGRRGETAAARRLLARARDVLESLPDPGDGLARLERTEKLLRLRAPRRASAAPAAFWELSPRELEVLRLLPSSLTQREMAAELFVSFNTVRTHTRVIFSKLGVTSRPEAVARARELGLI